MSPVRGSHTVVGAGRPGQLTSGHGACLLATHNDWNDTAHHAQFPRRWTAADDDGRPLPRRGARTRGAGRRDRSHTGTWGGVRQRPTADALCDPFGDCECREVRVRPRNCRHDRGSRHETRGAAAADEHVEIGAARHARDDSRSDRRTAGAVVRRETRTQTVTLTGEVAIQSAVSRKTAQPIASIAMRRRAVVSLVLMPAKNNAEANSTTPST